MPSIKIGKTIDLIALLALIFSLISLCVHLYFIFSGYKIKLYQPKEILVCASTFQDKWDFVCLSAVMTYANSGRSGYEGFNDVVKKEMVTMKLGDKSYDFLWDDFVSPTLNGAELKMNRTGNAIPFLIKAGDVATHETYFAPFTDPKEKVNRAKNWIEWKDFEKAISEVNKIYFTFKIETYGGKLDKASCMVEIDKGFREYCKKRGYYFALCN